ncbi:sulfur carrier protein ThiS [Vibrio mexicanus]|uniref:sulfur carrier protein ThiS n=1 Tax=Vibrio mexicanus TaxID=1004326 RepID=UPI00063CC111|nr:sulfur carrier protein ThiS [Vibrio mexicanus]
METIQVVINDTPTSVKKGASLSEVISELDLPNDGCVFSINNTVVPKSTWQTTILNQGDSISLFQAIAGG